ncbi:hypothetical protein NOJ28_06265 [Neorhizobium galegae]|uniref:hypothetical protein n=1 Tax=Neorhizobium galegae TaxID=399 RepID=UPI0006219294|nr:hypothetical protein [Neorhizobium galegae]MCQ1765126.1 hypothetical protein [Neorhizobium galegae]MCQ1844039.1 hypothetical protein [Neorhizobium galegae]CDZ33836.1 Hypothetical protein NGAL_HAMBI1146_05840 [Neorhizobium galegae bv. officinalis]
MLKRPIALSALLLSLAVPVLAQTSGPGATPTLPGTTTTTPGANSAATTLPGVADPTTTNSTTGTVDQEDHCQPPGTPSNTNPSAEAPTLPRPEQACN